MPLNLAKLEAAGVDFAKPQEWTPAVQGLRGVPGSERTVSPTSRGSSPRR
ncbi:hypothetical protein MYXO_01168 [Myxococcaceae bacterium]|nr:hypothetical protein MYXO_01168 [Myxococcaceae bacterium]